MLLDMGVHAQPGFVVADLLFSPCLGKSHCKVAWSWHRPDMVAFANEFGQQPSHSAGQYAELLSPVC